MLLTIAALYHDVMQVEVTSDYVVLNLEPALAQLLFLPIQKSCPCPFLKPIHA